MDGWITIGTDVDSRNFEKELNKLEKESKKFEKEEQQLLKQKAEIDLTDYNKEIELAKEAQKEVEELIKKRDSYAKGSTMYNSTQSSIDFAKLNVTPQSEIDARYSTQLSDLELINQKLAENASNQEKVRQKIKETKNEMSEIHLSYDNIGKSIKDNIKQIGKWVGAIFGIRTAFNVIRQAMSTISSYNDGINNKLYSMKMIFASALEPLITRIVNLAWKLMSYVAYIAKAWFGIDILSKANANSLKAGAKSAKEMKKAFAGWDEMTVLNDNGTTGSKDSNTPKFEMPDISEDKIPSWIKWIADNKDIVLGFFTGLATLWATIKVASFIANLKKVKDGLLGTAEGSKKATSTMEGFGKLISSALIAGGLLLIATSMFNLIKNWNDLTPAEKSAEVALILLGVAFVALGLTIRGAIDTATFGLAEIIGLITALVAAIGSLIAHLLSQEKSIKSVEQASKDLKEAQEELKQATDDYANSLDNYDNALKKVEESAKKLEEAEKKNKMSGEDLFNQVKEGSLTYQEMNEKQKEVFKAYIDNQSAQENLKKSSKDLESGLQKLTEAQKKEKTASWDNKLALAAEKGEYDKYKKAVIDAFEKGELSAKEARDLIGKSMSEMSRDSQKTFMEDLPNDIKNGLDPKNYETFGQKFKKFFSGLWDGVKKAGSGAFDWIKGKFGFAKGGVVYGGDVYGFAKGGITYPKLQYCASGAIVNQPGRGVPVTQAIAGERGAEGILPLTDSQQMDLLGQSIARHMTINLTNINQMNGRILSKELKKIEAQQEFATNG